MIYLSIFKGRYSVQLRPNLYHFFPEREEESCEGREGLKRRCCPASTHIYTAMCCMKRFCCGDTASQYPQRSWVVFALPDTSRVKVSCCLTGRSLTLAEQGDWSFQSHTVICIGEITSSYRKSPVKSTRFSTGPRPLSVGLRSRLQPKVLQTCTCNNLFTPVETALKKSLSGVNSNPLLINLRWS